MVEAIKKNFKIKTDLQNKILDGVLLGISVIYQLGDQTERVA